MLSIGIASNTAVKILLAKKNPGTTILVLDYLSIFKSSVLNGAFASLIFKTSNLLQTTVIRKTGMMTDRTKITYETRVAIFLP